MKWAVTYSFYRCLSNPSGMPMRYRNTEVKGTHLQTTRSSQTCGGAGQCSQCCDRSADFLAAHCTAPPSIWEEEKVLTGRSETIAESWIVNKWFSDICSHSTVFPSYSSAWAGAEGPAPTQQVRPPSRCVHEIHYSHPLIWCLFFKSLCDFWQSLSLPDTLKTTIK